LEHNLHDRHNGSNGHKHHNELENSELNGNGHSHDHSHELAHVSHIPIIREIYLIRPQLEAATTVVYIGLPTRLEILEEVLSNSLKGRHIFVLPGVDPSNGSDLNSRNEAGIAGDILSTSTRSALEVWQLFGTNEGHQSDDEESRRLPKDVMFLLPGLVLEEAMMSNLLGFDIPWQSGTFYDRGAVPFACSSTSHISNSIKSVIEKTSNKGQTTPFVLYDAEFTQVTQAKLCKVLEKCMDTDFGIAQASLAEARKEGLVMIKTGWGKAGMLNVERAEVFGADWSKWGAGKGSEDNLRRTVQAIVDTGGSDDASCGC
jgi:hypothetical protein